MNGFMIAIRGFALVVLPVLVAYLAWIASAMLRHVASASDPLQAGVIAAGVGYLAAVAAVVGALLLAGEVCSIRLDCEEDILG
jgi:hypothetical protein